jgi:hypothetical protein
VFSHHHLLLALSPRSIWYLYPAFTGRSRKIGTWLRNFPLA